jgi:hypothetical protein
VGFVFDTSRDIHLQVFPRSYTFAELNEHLDGLERFYVDLARTRPLARVCLLADARIAPKMDARGRQRIAQSFGRLAPILQSRGVAHAAVVAGRLAQGALTAILWVRTPPWPLQIFAHMEDADAWIRSRLAAEGMKAPALPRQWWTQPPKL